MRSKQKEEALRRMDLLVKKGMMPEVRKSFEEDNLVLISERVRMIEPGKPFGLLLTQESVDNLEEYKEFNISGKIKEFEKSYSALVYHATLERFEFGLCLDLFYVSSYEEEWERDYEDMKENFVCAYVVNLSDDFSSEGGIIGFEASGGGIIRTA